MGRRRGYKMTDAEMMKCEYNEPCPLPGCKGRAAQMTLSRVNWKECGTCGHQWGFLGGSNKSITREQKDELVGLRVGGRGAGESEERHAQARRVEQYRQEAQEMTQSKKTTKGAGQKNGEKPKTAGKVESKGAKKPSMAAIIRSVFEKNPAATDEQVVQAFKKQYPDAKSGAARVQRWRKRLGVKQQPTKPTKAPKAKKPVAERKG